MRDWGLALMAMAAGTMDVLAFTQLGHVLPSAMTGNTALLGLSLGQGRFAAAIPFLIAFGAFCGGAALTATVLGLRRGADPSPHLAYRLLVVEALLLAVFLVGWLAADRPFGTGVRDGLIVPAAFAMGMQSGIARLGNRPGINTIVFTSTLSAIVGAVTQALLRRPHSIGWDTRRQIGMFAAYFVGAVASGLLVLSGSPAMAALPLAAVLGSLVLHWRFAARPAAT